MHLLTLHKSSENKTSRGSRKSFICANQNGCLVIKIPNQVAIFPIGARATKHPQNRCLWDGVILYDEANK